MKETNEIIAEVANRLGEHIKEKIERTLSPLNVLNYIVEKRGEPVLTYNDIYDPNGTMSRTPAMVCTFRTKTSIWVSRHPQARVN